MIVSLNKLGVGLKAEDLFKSIYECDDKDIRVMIKKDVFPNSYISYFEIFNGKKDYYQKHFCNTLDE